MSYLYGSLYRSGHRAHALNILAVDYDGGFIGQSISGAYSRLEGNDFPSLQFAPLSEYPSIQDARDAVCRGDYWAAIVSQPGASSRLSAALGGGVAAARYESNDTLTYVYNGARYAAVELGEIVASLQALIGAAVPAYHALNGTEAIKTLNASDSAAVMAFTNPIRPSSIEIMRTPQGTRILFNTVSMVLPIIQQFFFLMALNGINNNYGIYGRLRSSRIGIMRLSISLIYTFLASLTVAGYIWAYREDWGVTANQFALTWMTYWMYMHINFLVLDAITAFIPPSFLAFFVLTWTICNVTSAIYPFELNAGFYRWGYALPAREMYTVLVQVWSGGCNNQLHIALPILFAWEVVGVTMSVLGGFYRNANARREILAVEAKLDDEASGGAQVATMEEIELLKMETRRHAGPSFPMPFLTADRRPIGAMRRQGTV
ncbi:hypothetical protein IFR05_010919 [Cadophora sp. M221]|nr:hypothetical protein IFR05_010919 [Cadophora sp. M221]